MIFRSRPNESECTSIERIAAKAVEEKRRTTNLFFISLFEKKHGYAPCFFMSKLEHILIGSTLEAESKSIVVDIDIEDEKINKARQDIGIVPIYAALYKKNICLVASLFGQHTAEKIEKIVKEYETYVVAARLAKVKNKKILAPPLPLIPCKECLEMLVGFDAADKYGTLLTNTEILTIVEFLESRYDINKERVADIMKRYGRPLAMDDPSFTKRCLICGALRNYCCC